MDAARADIDALENGIAKWQWKVVNQGRVVFTDYIQHIFNKDYDNSISQLNCWGRV